MYHGTISSVDPTECHARESPSPLAKVGFASLSDAAFHRLYKVG
uniref:Uncharacterized protein n=1 Tax=Arundo donax TaxID=35708 RepID=A0A0A8ZX62_ARUDO